MKIKINSWEEKSEEFLDSVFDKDSDDIVDFLCRGESGTIVEVGFGNNRLLPKILNLGLNINYFGLDKTKAFVDRAKLEFDLPKVSFFRISIADISKFTKVIKGIKPDLLILRYIVEHLPEWKRALKCVNRLKIQNILISIHTPYVKGKTWSVYDLSTDYENAYTINFFGQEDLKKCLSNYRLDTFCRYEDVPHTFRVYKLK